MIIRVAKYLGCTPWELEEQSVQWLHRGLAAMEADSLAEGSVLDDSGASSQI